MADILVTFLTAEELSVRASYPGEVADKLLSDKGQDKKSLIWTRPQRSLQETGRCSQLLEPCRECKMMQSSPELSTKSYCWVTTSASNQETLNSNLEQWLQEAVSTFLMAQTQDPKSWYQRWATLSGWIKRPSRPGWHEGVLTQKRGAGRIKRRSGCSSYRSWSLSVRGDVMENDFQAASKSL